MNIEFLSLIVACVCHVLIFRSALSASRKKKLAIGLALTLLSIPLFLVGLFLGLSGDSSTKDYALALINAPIYMPIISFLIYWPRVKTPQQS